MRDLRRDPRTARILHTRAQLLVAAVACQLGWGVALEPSGSDRPPADVHLVTPAGEISVEVRVFTQSESGREQFAAAESGSEWLMMLGIQEHVWISGKLDRHLTPAERREIERFVKRNAAAAYSGEKPRLQLDGIALALVDRAATAGTLSGPTVRESLFERMVSAIAARARRMQNSGAEWLHITVLTGLWAFTPWGTSPLAEKLATMMAALDEALGDDRPAGIVLYSGAGLTPEVNASSSRCSGACDASSASTPRSACIALLLGAIKDPCALAGPPRAHDHRDTRIAQRLADQGAYAAPDQRCDPTTSSGQIRN